MRKLNFTTSSMYGHKFEVGDLHADVSHGKWKIQRTYTCIKQEICQKSVLFVSHAIFNLAINNPKEASGFSAFYNTFQLSEHRRTNDTRFS